MGWITTVKIDNIKLGIITAPGPGLMVGFMMNDEKTLQLLRSRDDRILDALAQLPDIIDDISTAMWATESQWWERDPSGDIENFLQKLRSLQNNQFAAPELRERAAKQAAIITKKRATKREKRARTKRRRSQFQRQRDALALTLIERDGYSCRRCGTTKNLTIDHIKPLSKGGTDDLDNLQWLCQSCNSKKGDSNE